MADFFSTADSSVSTTGELTQIGHVNNIAGNVEVTRPDGSVSTLSAGDFIHEGDVVSTDGAGVLGVVLVDGSVISMSANSIITFDDFLYNQETQDGNLALEAVQGVFTFVSGQISKADPDAMVINTPTATIGIRGTQGGVNVDGQSGATDVVLMRESDGQVGEITVQTNAGAVVLNKEASGTTALQSSQPPTTPADVPLNTMLQTYKQSLQAMPEVGTVNRYDANTENTGSTTEESTDSEAEAETAEAEIAEAEAEAEAETETGTEEAGVGGSVARDAEALEAAIERATNYTERMAAIKVMADVRVAEIRAMSDNAEVQMGNYGDAVIRAVSGESATLHGAGGWDRIHGGEGDDNLLGGQGGDVLRGGPGDDTLRSSDEKGTADKSVDELYGGAGNDTLYADAGGGDDLYGEEGNDTLHGNESYDYLYGGEGADTLYGKGQKDYMYTNDKDNASDDAIDTLYGGAGDDWMYADKGGNDQLYGEAGNDTLHGNDGDDSLYGGDGNDILRGGYIAPLNQYGNIENLLESEKGNDTLYGGGGSDRLYGGGGNDTLYANNQNNDGDGAADTLYGGGGNDTLYGGGGENGDNLSGGAGDDTLHVRGSGTQGGGGTGNDTISFYDTDGIKEVNHFTVGWGNHAKDASNDIIKLYLHDSADTKLKIDSQTKDIADFAGKTFNSPRPDQMGFLDISTIDENDSTDSTESSTTKILGYWDSYSVSAKKSDDGGQYVEITFTTT